jgi:hypothetical protein
MVENQSWKAHPQCVWGLMRPFRSNSMLICMISHYSDSRMFTDDASTSVVLEVGRNSLEDFPIEICSTRNAQWENEFARTKPQMPENMARIIIIVCNRVGPLSSARTQMQFGLGATEPGICPNHNVLKIRSLLCFQCVDMHGIRSKWWRSNGKQFGNRWHIRLFGTDNSSLGERTEAKCLLPSYFWRTMSIWSSHSLPRRPSPLTIVHQKSNSWFQWFTEANLQNSLLKASKSSLRRSRDFIPLNSIDSMRMHCSRLTRNGDRDVQ